LDHNLLTITDPLGQEFLRNVYTSITDPAMRGFDRLSHQFLPDGTIFYYYVPEVPAPGNGMATTRTIVLDRARNVREASFNAHNQMVVLREFTGRAPSSNGPTTDTTNRPTGKLRAQDPDFYETRGICDVDSLRTSVQYPCDDQMTASYMKHVNPAANRREQGNLLQFTTFPGPRGGDQSSITEQFQHLSGFGSCCGDIFVTQHVDGRTNQTTHSYDSRGNRLQTLHPVSGVVEDYEYDGYGQMTAYIHPDNGTGWRSRDEFVYDSNPNLRVASASGDPYLLERRVDVLGQSLVTTFEHDAVGNVTRTINPLNQDTLHTFNALDQVVRVSSRKVSPASAVRYLRDTFYNANDQVFRVDVQNLDADGVLQPNAAFSTTHTFDTLGRIIAIKKEVDPTHDIQKIFAYDANGNQREIRDGESAALRQVANMVRVSYDERDLTFRETEAPDSPDASTTQYDYDCGGNVTRATLGLEAVPHVYQYTYDGYDRMTVAQAPLGNVQDFHYDPNDNLQSMQFQGEVLDTPGGGANILIADVGFVYDAMNRPTRRELEHFDLETLADIGDGKSTTVYEYNAASQLFKVTDDNGRIMQAQFDSALRLSEWTDAKGNRVTYSYDDGMNLTSVVQTEIAGLGGPDQQFSTTYEYDGLGRVTRRADSSGNTTDMAYDSRNNLTLLTDALRVPSPGGAGNKTTSTYDGLNRQLSSTLTLTSNGQGNGVPSGNITVTQDWDDSGRLTEECDGVGHCTQYTYDPKNQVIRIDHADGTFETREYDIHGHVTRVVDANGTVIDSTYDDLDGLTHRTITPGTGVSNATTFVDYKYDGLSRVVRAETDQALVTRKYDSLSNVVQETINGLTVQSLFDGEGNSIQDTYPDGTILFTTFDELNRKSTISNQAGLIAEYFYDGPGRVRRRNYGNGTRTDYTYDGLDGVPNPPGDFGVQQLTRLTASSIATGVPFDDRSFKWDRVGSRVQRENLLAATPGLPRSHQYEYDSAYRLKRTTILDPTSTTLSVTDYGLDATGNRVTVTGPGGGAYTSSSTLPSPGDAQMNQYTSTPFDTRAYDGNGNMVATLATGMPQPRVLSYDYDNQLVQVIDPNSGLDVRFAYDAFGRRVSKYVGGAGTPSFRYAYREGQEIAETNGAGATLATFVYGNKVDELLMMRRGGANHFYQADDQNTVVSLTNAAGAVLERYDYDDFGKPAALSTFGNPYLFGGRRYDADIGLYYYRARYLDPSVGRFVTRDPLGAWGDAMNAGNAFTYVGNNPWSRTDPTGMLGAINYVGCEGKENSVYLDLMRSETLARGAYSHLAGGSRILHACDMRYMTWFGFYKKSRYETVTSGFAAIKGFVSDENLTINCTSAGSDCLSANAYVDYDVPDTVYLCSNYFHFNSNLGIKALGLFGGSYDDRTARGAILLHEFSHLKANTEDLGKMPWTCQGLARTDPSRAIRNANNYLYFAISPIEGYCSLSQLLATTVLNSARELVGSAGRLALRAEKKAAKFLERAADKVSSAAKRWKKKWKWH
jgi:RHS repeat-associated protein